MVAESERGGEGLRVADLGETRFEEGRYSQQKTVSPAHFKDISALNKQEPVDEVQLFSFDLQEWQWFAPPACRKSASHWESLNRALLLSTTQLQLPSRFL
jgi:hypothetical protein